MTEYIGEWTTVDKSEWGDGPWQAEPDKVHWIDKATDMDCLMVRGPLGIWCGYVGVTKGHPAFDQDYDDVGVSVHGGLTYADFCQPGEDETVGVCHVPQAGRPEHVYWLGFDTGHAYDLIPSMRAKNRKRFLETGDPLWDDSSPIHRAEAYRDRAYVEHEVTDLARQLKDMEDG